MENKKVFNLLCNRLLNNNFMCEDEYNKGHRVCGVSTQVNNGNKEQLICYGDMKDETEKELRKFLRQNYDGIKNYGISYAEPDSYAALYYRHEPDQEWFLTEIFNLEIRKPSDFYNSGTLTKPARK